MDIHYNPILVRRNTRKAGAGARCCYFCRKRSHARVLPWSVTNGSVAAWVFIIARQFGRFLVAGRGRAVVTVSGHECRYWVRSFRRGQDVICGVNCAVLFGLSRATIRLATMNTLFFLEINVDAFFDYTR